MDDRWLDVSTVARKLGCSSQLVRNLIRAGRLEARRLNPPRGHWRVREVSVDVFAASTTHTTHTTQSHAR